MKTKEVMEKVIELSLANGAQGSDVILSEGKSFSASVQNADLDKYEVSGSKILGVRVIKDQKIGLSFTEDFTADSLEVVVSKAIENSQFSKVNENAFIANDSKESSSHIDNKTEEIEVNDLIELNKELESKVKELDKRVSGSPYNGVSENESKSHFLNSNGRYCYEEDYSLSCYTSALIKDGEKNSLHYYGSVAKKLSELDYQKCIDESFHHAKEWLDASPIKSGKYPVIFSIDQMQSLFGAFHRMYSAKARMEKSNPMSEKLNQQIFSKNLSILDVPTYEKALFASPFDSEGYAREDLTLIENGVLKNFFHNSETAAFFKEENNFRAARGARSALSVGGTHTLIQKGKDSEKDLTSQKYLMVHSMQGLHSGLNFMSGDFSFGASGYLMENGEALQAVNGITVAGNFYDLLNEIDGIGDTIHSNSSTSFFAPTIRFSKLTVAGV